MALKNVIWPWDDLGGRPQITSVLLSARDEKFGQNSLYGLRGHYMEVNIWPWDDLGGRPQITSILLSARDEKFGRNSLYGL